MRFRCCKQSNKVNVTSTVRKVLDRLFNILCNLNFFEFVIKIGLESICILICIEPPWGDLIWKIGNCLIDFGITFGVILVNFDCVYALAFFLKIETC